jgi:hypothetical protein
LQKFLNYLCVIELSKMDKFRIFNLAGWALFAGSSIYMIYSLLM